MDGAQPGWRRRRLISMMSIGVAVVLIVGGLALASAIQRLRVAAQRSSDL